MCRIVSRLIVTIIVKAFRVVSVVRIVYLVLVRLFVIWTLRRIRLSRRLLTLLGNSRTIKLFVVRLRLRRINVATWTFMVRTTFLVVIGR